MEVISFHLLDKNGNVVPGSTKFVGPGGSTTIDIPSTTNSGIIYYLQAEATDIAGTYNFEVTLNYL